MTYSEREEIFSKESLSINDMANLLGVSYYEAAKIIRNIKRRTDRLRVKGRIHIQDYFDYFDIPTDRYVKPIE